MKYDAKLQDLINIPTYDNGEKFLIISGNNIIGKYIPYNNDMEAFFGGNIIVRETILSMLINAQHILNTKLGLHYKLHVTYGYRNLEIQTKKYQGRIETLKKDKNNFGYDLESLAHITIAHPKVAGHPTGGAIDVLIRNDEQQSDIDFGSNIYDYSNENYKFYNLPDSTKFDQAKENRNLLREVMMKAGFTPYDGEYRHFSYGDKERAFYNNCNAIYNQIFMSDILCTI